MINSETNNYRTRINIEVTIGADIKVGVAVPIYLLDNINETIRSIDGVRELCFVSKAYSFNDRDGMQVLILVDKSYFDISFMKGEYLDGIDKNAARAIINSSEKTILSIYAKREADYKIGSEFIFPLGSSDSPFLLNFTVSGFIKFAPGISGMFEPQTEIMGIVGFEVLERIPSHLLGWINIEGILIDVEAGYNATEIAIEIRDKLNEMGIGSKVYVFDKALRDVRKHWAYAYSSVFINIMFVMTITMSIVGMTLTMVASILERRREIALFRVRGASRSEILGIIGGEALIITILGYVVGLIVSIAYSYGMLVSMSTLSYTLMGIYVEFPPGYMIRIPLSLFLVLGFAFMMFILSAILPLFLIFREDISEELRVRH